MRMYLLSDNVDTLMGMRMSGVEGKVLHEEAELRAALDKALSKDDIAVIMITEKLIGMIRDTVNQLKLTRSKPLIIEIPDRHGSGSIGDAITRYVKDAIGVNLNSGE